MANEKKTKKKSKLDFSDEAIRPFYASVGAADVAFGVVRDYVGDASKRLSSASDDVTAFVDDLQKVITDLAKSDAKELAEALKTVINEKVAALQKDAKERQETVESVASSIGKDYKSYPALAKSLLSDGAGKAEKNYTELAERGETLVNGLIGQATEAAEKVAGDTKEAFAGVVDDVKGAVTKTKKAGKDDKKAKPAAKKAAKPAAKKAAAKPAAKPAAKKAPAKKAPAKPAAAKKAPAKAAPAAAKPAPAAAKPAVEAAAPAAAKPAAPAAEAPKTETN